MKVFLSLLFSSYLFISLSRSSDATSGDFSSRLKNVKIDLPDELQEFIKTEIENPSSYRNGEIVAIIDDYADKVFENIEELIIHQGLDPVELEDTSLKLIPTGTIALSSGYLQNLSTLKRNGDVTVTYYSSSSTLEINVPIKFETLTVSYEYLTKILLLSIKGEAHGKVENLNIDVKLGFNFTTYEASLDNFDIGNTGKLSLIFTGNGLVDWIVNIMTTVVTTFLKPVILNMTKSVIRGGLQAALDAINSYIHSIIHPGVSTVANNLIAVL